jgi:hypothetical protein
MGAKRVRGTRVVIADGYKLTFPRAPEAKRPGASCGLIFIPRMRRGAGPR